MSPGTPLSGSIAGLGHAPGHAKKRKQRGCSTTMRGLTAKASRATSLFSASGWEGDLSNLTLPRRSHEPLLI